MRRPVVVLVLLAILGMLACCAGVGNGKKWWKKASTSSRKNQPEGSNTQRSNPPETPYYPDMSNIPQTTEAAPTYPIYYEPGASCSSRDINVAATKENFRDTVQQHTGQHRSTNFDQSHNSQHDLPYYPDMSNIPPPNPSKQSTNFTQQPSHYDQGMSSTIQPKTTKQKRTWLSKKPSTTYIQTDITNFEKSVQQCTAKPARSSTTARASTQRTNPAGDVPPPPNYGQFPAMSQNFPTQQTENDGGLYNAASKFFNPKHPKH